MSGPACTTLRLVLGDQLDAGHSWFSKTDPGVLYLLAELRQEATYVRHHVQKVAAFFLAMKAFADMLAEAGHRVLYLDLDATAACAGLPQLLEAMLARTGASRFEYQRPDEYRLQEQLEVFTSQLGLECRRCESEHFLLDFDEIGKFFGRNKPVRMEPFYRKMRKRLGVLVQADGQPQGGRWNFDAENRNRLEEGRALPPPLVFENPASAVYRRIREQRIPVLGETRGDLLDWPVTRVQSLELLTHFLHHGLPFFGRYQDALSGRDWLLFHSRLSFSLNAKMISPREVIAVVLDAWCERSDTLPLSSVEGFLRQIIGWREYVRGVYWANMPEYAQTNLLGHQNALPRFYWDGETRMACMASAIGQSLRYAYAHHIQRLMVTGNFALLSGVHPAAVDAWYLGIYIDAIEWVELPNTRGMSQYADGGIMASKPYVSSGNYIRKMSDHCTGCHYRVSARTGPDSCPFNSLYWHFMVRHRQALEKNPRIGMAYRTWDRMDGKSRAAVLATAEAHLERIEQL